MRETTRKKYERIRQAAAHMYGSMPAMQLYTALAEDWFHACHATLHRACRRFLPERRTNSQNSRFKNEKITKNAPSIATIGQNDQQKP